MRHSDSELPNEPRLSLWNLDFLFDSQYIACVSGASVL
jgi:hypothetical protein